MKKILVLIAAQLLAVTAMAASEAPTPIEPLKMITSDKGLAVYSEVCSNGRNSSDEQTVRDFIKAMENDNNSKLYKAEQAAVKSRYSDAYVWVSPTTLAANIRMGCSDAYNTLIATITTQIKSTNAHDMETQFIVVIKDTVIGTERTLELVEVKPFQVKSEYK